MRLECFVVWKSWTSNRLRVALSVLGVALGIAIVTAIHVIDHNTIESRLRALRPDFGRVDLELLPLDARRDPSEVRRRLETDPDIAVVGVLQQADAVLAAGGRQIAVPVFGMSPLPAHAFNHYYVQDGSDLSDLDGDAGVLIGAGLAQLASLSPGDRVTLTRPVRPPRTRCVQGVETPVDDGAVPAPLEATVEIKGVIADQRLGHRNAGVVMVTSFALARQLAPLQRPLYQINRRAGVDVDRLRQQLAAEFEVLDSRSALLGEASDERAFRNGVKVLGCLALVMGMFVIFQTLSQSLVERLRQIGLLRALGTSRGAITRMFLLDASATALLGAALGLALGVGLAFVLQRMDFSTLGRGKHVTTFELPIGPLLWTAAIGVAFTLAGAAFPLWKARNLPALEVLSSRGIRAGGASGETYVLRGINLFLFLMLVVVLPGAYLAMTPILSEEGQEARAVLLQLGSMILLFGGMLLVSPRLVQVLGRGALAPLRRRLRLPVFLVDKFLQQSPGRFAAAVCGLAVVLMALLALKSITYALRAEAREFGDVAMGNRLFVKCDPVPAGRARDLLRIPGVAGGELFTTDVAARFPLRGLSVETLTAPGGLLEGAPEVAAAYDGSRGLIVSKRLAHLRGKSVGDAMELLTDGGPVTYTVLEVSDRAGFFPDERAWAIAAPRWLHTDFCANADAVDHFSLTLAPGADANQVLAEVRALLPRAPWAKTGADITAYNLRDVTHDFALFDVLLGLILVLAGIGLLNTMTIAALGRVREIGVLRALGMDRRALRVTFLVEGGLVALLAAVLSLALAVPLGWVIVSGLNRVAGLEAPFVMPWAPALAVPVLATATGLLAAWLPGVRALAESPATAVRYE
jgi:putative ABC transport system permease protein